MRNRHNCHWLRPAAITGKKKFRVKKIRVDATGGYRICSLKNPRVAVCKSPFSEYRNSVRQCPAPQLSQGVERGDGWASPRSMICAIFGTKPLSALSRVEKVRTIKNPIVRPVRPNSRAEPDSSIPSRAAKLDPVKAPNSIKTTGIR